MIECIVKEKGLKDLFFSFDKDIIIIGRDTDCDLALDSGRVSHRHAKVENNGQIYYVEDLGSTNGTFLNGSPVSRAALTSQDRVTIDKYDFYFGLPRPSELRSDFIKKDIFSVKMNAINPTEVGGVLSQYYRKIEKKTGAETSNHQQDITKEEIFEKYQELYKVYKRMEVINEISQLINADINIDNVLNLILAEGLKYLNFERGFIMLKSLETEKLYIRSSRFGFDHVDKIKANILSTTVAEHVFNSNTSLMIENAQENEKFGQAESIIKMNIKSIIAVPLKIKGESIGTLYFDTIEQNKKYNEDDLDFLEKFANHAALALYNAQLFELSTIDGMTGVFCYRHFYVMLGIEFKRCKRYDNEFSLMFIDIDNFKSINDNYGHQAGDMVLRKVARLLNFSFREIDLIGRYGGDEFIICFPQTKSTDVNILTRRINNLIEKEDFLFNNKKISISLSIGIASYNKNIESTKELIEMADAALYYSKTHGKNQVTLYSPGLRIAKT
ncbi:MAG: diguanylate cyclase [bacterium]